MRWLGRCSISGSFDSLEIPLLLVLFYSFHGALTGKAMAFGVKFLLEFSIFVEDSVRWGVWLGRHICKKITQVS